MDIVSCIADTLHIPPEYVTDDLTYQSISEWSSLNHVTLILKLEEMFGQHINSTLFLQLTSVKAIKEYAQRFATLDETQRAAETEAQATNVREERAEIASGGPIYRGLAGVAFDTSTITEVDGIRGRLSYRGYAIEDLVAQASFAEVAHLLLYQDLPDPEQLAAFEARLCTAQELPHTVMTLLHEMVDAHPVDALRTAVSLLAAHDPEASNTSPEALRRRGIRLMGQVMQIITTHERLRRGQTLLAPRPYLSYAANFLYLLTGREPTPLMEHILNADLILHADHSANASAFVARIVMSTQADLQAAITAAMAAFAGALHGGAVEQVMPMLQEIGEPEYVATYVQRRREQHLPIMGFGHRVYRTEDPRATQMRRLLQDLSRACHEPRWLAITDALIDAMQPYARHGIHINVDFYASVIYHLLGIPQDIAISLFILGRMAGWLAQIEEQVENNILIRPLLHYVGQRDRAYIPLRERSSRLTKSYAAETPVLACR
ncbi:citrate (Si)-synthase [Ktedonosporobacter rubrisoli]|uniref:citrate synthase (unknown stereospecificity) n=1 Tax=Ktedonosporobacter rubrisoli TaxID=2509675 RepID=A0A4P6JND4_KTERU|nr:citrate/2-methylcitrate synthase [Ktedonosporobacter rubrisoli]QBD76784.1 citrate (Si)-synthase [Ktedonosporobacter rubrisoli]